jgi:hypothetical protein
MSSSMFDDPLFANGSDLRSDPADGAALLDDLHATLTRYVAFPDDHTARATTLWITTTHALPAFECAPRLAITSPQKRCGKTRLLDVIAGTCHSPLATSDATVAAIFRSLGGDHPPTLIIDEADTIWGSKKLAEQNEDLRKLINAGHQRGKPALRCVGPNQIPTEFNIFAMAALAGIGGLPDTITDRAVNITQRRRAPGEKVSQFRSRRDGPTLGGLRARLAEWAAGQIEALSTAEPNMPVEDRAADTWEPLIAVADAAGGHWPATARAACKAMVDAADSAPSYGASRSHLGTTSISMPANSRNGCGSTALSQGAVSETLCAATHWRHSPTLSLATPVHNRPSRPQPTMSSNNPRTDQKRWTHLSVHTKTPVHPSPQVKPYLGRNGRMRTYPPPKTVQRHQIRAQTAHRITAASVRTRRASTATSRSSANKPMSADGLRTSHVSVEMKR